MSLFVCCRLREANEVRLTEVIEWSYFNALRVFTKKWCFGFVINKSFVCVAWNWIDKVLFECFYAAVIRKLLRNNEISETETRRSSKDPEKGWVAIENRTFTTSCLVSISNIPFLCHNFPRPWQKILFVASFPAFGSSFSPKRKSGNSLKSFQGEFTWWILMYVRVCVFWFVCMFSTFLIKIWQIIIYRFDA